jgi:endoglucanase
MTSRRRFGTFALAVALVLTGAVRPAPVAAAPAATGEFNYAEALQDSMWFYEAQRSGRLPADNRVSWRGDSDLNDGADHGIDLTGGYHDAGDEVKFGLPLAYTLTTLAWGGIADSAGYTGSGQMTYLLRNLRWGDDYLIKAHPSPHVFYAQVGDGNTDHAFWGPAEVNPTARPSYAVTESCPGSDVVGQSAAALAASSILFRSSDPGYAATLLSQAESLYEFADDYRGTYDACIPGVGDFYKSWSGYWDELTWGAIWLYKATGDTSYLAKAESYFGNLGKTQDGTPKYDYTISWDDSTFGIYILLAEITGQQEYITDAERNLDWLTTGYDGRRASYSPGGEAQIDVWGVARYAADAAFTALDFGNWLAGEGLDAARAQTYHDFGVRQINYILGDNPNHESYEIGFTNSGTNSTWPMFVHNRTAHGSWDQSMDDPPYTRHTEYGLLVGGPTGGSDTFDDSRQDYQQTEGALDYNALFSGALAELVTEYGGTPRASFPTETPDGPEMYVAAAVNQAGSDFIEIKSQIYNKSGWPARALTDGTLRYYFTLDAGMSPDQLTLTSPYAECPNPLSVRQYSGDIYYLQVDCTGQDIAPAGQSAWHRENQFRITFPGPHDYTRDWSYTGVAAQGQQPVTVDDIALYDGTTKVWGNEPG